MAILHMRGSSGGMSNEVNDSHPVLLIAFNRPDLTRRVFDRIREAHPERLFIAVDGPRPDHPDDHDKCAEVRSLVAEVDWPCDVQTLFREKNLGCKLAVSSAITWFFDHVEEGIILEDDCLPDMTFFRFCGELLQYYRHDARVMLIAGNNFQSDGWQKRYSYYFSMYPLIWGWASWRRAWRYYDIDMVLWPELNKNAWLSHLFGELEARSFWTQAFDECFTNAINTWDRQWVYSCWIQNALSVTPSANLVSNIGYGVESTHTFNSSDTLACRPVHALDFPLLHPKHMIRDFEADEYTLANVYRVRPYKPLPFLARARHRVHRALKKSLAAVKDVVGI